MHLNCLLNKYFLFFIFIINESFSSIDPGFVDSRTPTASFESFIDSLSTISIDEKQRTLWTFVETAFEDPIKSINLIKHLIKGQHLIPFSEINKKPSLPLALPINLKKDLFDFVKSFYLMFDISETRMGQIKKLKNFLVTSRLNDENLIKLDPIFRKLIPIAALSTLSPIEKMRSLTMLSTSEFFKILKTLPKTRSLSIKDILITTESLFKVMEMPCMTKFNGEELAKKCFFISRLADLVGIIPSQEKFIPFVERKIQAINKKTPFPIVEFNEFSTQLINIIHEENTFEKKIPEFKALKESIEQSIEMEIERLIVAITKMYEPIEEDIIPILRTTKQSILDDIFVFINNPDNLSSTPIEANREMRRDIPQLCLTRKYSNTSLEFKKYIEACIRDLTITASNPSYDVLIKSVISKDEGIIYLSTFFAEKK